jgi:transposase InsO family protein
VRFPFIEQQAATYPVRLMCRVLEVSPSGYYAWRSRPESSRATENRTHVSEIRRLQARHGGRYGSPRMHAALRVGGHRCSRGRVERLMRRHRIRALAGRRFLPCTTDSRHHLAVAPNLLAQRFEAPTPSRVWLSDLTYIPTSEGWLYLAAILDLATRKVVGWVMRDHIRVELTLSALIMAVQRQRPPPGLAAIGAVPSKSRKGCCYDNARTESFFHTLKVELVHQQRWATRAEARRDLFSYTEAYYNRARMHSALGNLTPEQAEQRVAS